MKLVITKDVKDTYAPVFDKIFDDYAYKGAKGAEAPKKLIESNEFQNGVFQLLNDLAIVGVLGLDGKEVDWDFKSGKAGATDFETIFGALECANVSMDQNRGAKEKYFEKGTKIPQEFVRTYGFFMSAAFLDAGYIKQKLFDNQDKFMKKLAGLVKSYNKQVWNESANANQSRTGLLGMAQKGMGKHNAKKENPSPADYLMMQEAVVCAIQLYGDQLAAAIYKTIVK